MLDLRGWGPKIPEGVPERWVLAAGICDFMGNPIPRITAAESLIRFPSWPQTVQN